MRFRVELRSHWQAWLTLALVAGLAGGVLVAAAAGARRTDTALARYQAAYLFRNARLWGGSPLSFGPLEKQLPDVAASSIGADVGGDVRDARGQLISTKGFADQFSIYASVDGKDGVTVDRWKLLSGRLPHENRASDVLVDSRAARTFGVKPGDTFRLSGTGPPRVRLKVVGVVASTDPVGNPNGVVRLTKAFYRSHPSAYFDYSLDVRLRHGPADFPAFRRAVDREGYGGEIEYDQAQQSGGIQASIHELVQALWLGVAAGAVLAFLLLAQSLSRLSVAASRQYPTLRAVGMTSRQLLAVGIVRAATIALAAAAVAVGVALALSPLAPIGYARELEPTPGFRVDPLVVGLGAAAVLAAVLAAGAFAAWRAAERGRGLPASGPARVRSADALARWGLPAPVATGVRLALARRRGTNVLSAGSALAGVTLAVVITTAAFTFSASLHHLFTTPHLFGQNWDLRTDGAGPLQVTQGERDRAISALAGGTDKGSVSVNGREVGVWAMTQVKGRIEPTILAGRVPRSNEEIALGTRTMRALGVDIGDTVHVEGPRGSARLRVVGRVVLPSNYNTQLGEGAVMTPDEWGGKLGTPGGVVLLVRLRPGANPAPVEHFLASSLDGLPTPVANFGGVTELPAAISAVLVAIGLAALAQTLVVAVRRRRRDLAILKTLGFDRRQVLATVVCQAATLAAIGLLIGLPLGVAAGRWVWNSFANELGVLPAAVTPIPWLLAMVPCTILLASLVATIPGRVAARTRPAVVLRAE
jgi:ABC-type lipoprotein release transport system permease subunit